MKLRLPSAAYAAVVGAATLLSGCQGVEKREGLEAIACNSNASILEVAENTVSTYTQPETPLVADASRTRIQLSASSVQHSIPSISSIEPNPRTQDLEPRAQETRPRTDRAETDRLLLDFRSSWRDYTSPSFTNHLSLSDVTCDLYGREDDYRRSNDIPKYDLQQANTYRPHSGLDFTSGPRAMATSFNLIDSEFTTSNKIGARELKIALEATREIIRRMGRENYGPMKSVDHFITQCEKLGARLQAIENGIQEIWTINFSNFTEDFTNPLGPFFDAVDLDKSPESYRQRTSSRANSRPSRVNIGGTLEPTINGNPIGSRTGQDIMGLLSGQSKVDFGVQLRLEIQF